MPSHCENHWTEFFSTTLYEWVPHPASLEDVHNQWSIRLSQTLRGMLPAKNKWTATYDYWLSTLPLLKADCFDLCDSESSKYRVMTWLLWVLNNQREAVDLERAKGHPGMQIPSYEELTADAAFNALSDRLRGDLESKVYRPELSRLWQQVRDPDYRYYPPPEAKRSKATSPRRAP